MEESLNNRLLQAGRSIKKNRLLHICGPTCSGKTQLAHEIFEKTFPFFNGIINCDSRQFYKHTSIATAKPNLADIKRYSYHFCNHLPLGEHPTAHEWALQVEELLQTQEHDRFIVVGGPSLYSAQLSNRLPSVAKNIQTNYNAWYQHRLQSKGLSNLLRELRNKDVEHYNTVDKKNPRRVIRALSLMAESGKTTSEVRKMLQPTGISMVTWNIVPARKKLYQDATSRVYNMLDLGLLNEANWLLENGHEKNVLKLGAIGYAELFSHLKGNISETEAILKMCQLTRNLAKKQMTWIKKSYQLQKAYQQKGVQTSAPQNSSAHVNASTGNPHLFFLLTSNGVESIPKNVALHNSSVGTREDKSTWNDYFGLEKEKDESILPIKNTKSILKCFL